VPSEPVRILLVVDQPADARRLSEVLGTDRAHQVTRAERISSALALLRGQAFDTVVIDLGLPDSHGADGIERVVRAFPAVPVVVLSGTSDLERSRAALLAGAEAVLAKEELQPEPLALALREAVVLHRMLVRLTHPGSPSDAELAPLRGLREGVAVVARGKVISLNEVGARLLSEARASDPAEVAELFAHTLSGPRPPASPHTAPRAEGTATGLGELRLLRDDGSRATSRYVRRVLTLPHGVHALIRILPPLPETEVPAPPPPPPPPPDAPTPEESVGPRPRAARSHRPASRRARSLPAPAIDPAAWAGFEQRLESEPVRMQAAVNRFLEDGDRFLHAITAAVEADTPAEAVGPAQRFRELCSDVGALRLGQACAKLEQAAGSADPGRVTELTRSLSREFERVGSELRTRLAPSVAE
jgi:CheY-like chemotaxis protein/HPt (histidine-containing phosphotransfer) domain-containing protein